jgi:hypothetical protein
LKQALGAFLLCATGYLGAADQPPADILPGEVLPKGKSITPTAARGAIFQDLNPRHPNAPDVRATGGAAVTVAPDGTVLAILGSGYNSSSDRDGKSTPDLASDYVFLFDVTGTQPKLSQVLPVHTTFQRLSWAPSSDRLFVSGGIDDAVVEFVGKEGRFVPGRTLHMGHTAWIGPDIKAFAGPGGQNCPGCKGEVSGLAISADGQRLLVANIMNDSVSMIDVESGRIVAERGLRPGVIDSNCHGQPGGSYPRAVAWASPARAYVASERDREIIALAIAPDRLRVVCRILVPGRKNIGVLDSDLQLGERRCRRSEGTMRIPGRSAREGNRRRSVWDPVMEPDSVRPLI